MRVSFSDNPCLRELTFTQKNYFSNSKYVQQCHYVCFGQSACGQLINFVLKCLHASSDQDTEIRSVGVTDLENYDQKSVKTHRIDVFCQNKPGLRTMFGFYDFILDTPKSRRAAGFESMNSCTVLVSFSLSHAISQDSVDFYSDTEALCQATLRAYS